MELDDVLTAVLRVERKLDRLMELLAEEEDVAEPISLDLPFSEGQRPPAPKSL